MQKEMLIVKCIFAVLVGNLVLNRIVVERLPAFAHVIRILGVMEVILGFILHIAVFRELIRDIVVETTVNLGILRIVWQRLMF